VRIVWYRENGINTIGFKFLCLPALIGLVLVIVGIIILSTIGSSSCPGCGKTDSYCCVRADPDVCSGQNMCYCQDDGAYSPEDYYCKHVTVNDGKAGGPLIGGGVAVIVIVAAIMGYWVYRVDRTNKETALLA
jgi:hypothetical protein